MYVDWHTKCQVYIKMRKFIMFITAVCVLFFINTVFTRVNAAALFKFLVFQMRRLFGGGAYLRAALFKKS